MANLIDMAALMRDKRVLAEIDRHLWIESEKAGKDIGFDQAREDWLKRFSKAWMSYHMPDTVLQDQKAERIVSKRESDSKPKRRSAKSYFK